MGKGVDAPSFPYITGSRGLAVKGFGHPGICLFLFVWLPGDVPERAGTRPLSSSMPLIAELGKPVCVADFLGEMVFLEKRPVTLQASLWWRGGKDSMQWRRHVLVHPWLHQAPEGQHPQALTSSPPWRCLPVSSAKDRLVEALPPHPSWLQKVMVLRSPTPILYLFSRRFVLEDAPYLGQTDVDRFWGLITGQWNRPSFLSTAPEPGKWKVSFPQVRNPG